MAAVPITMKPNFEGTVKFILEHYPTAHEWNQLLFYKWIQWCLGEGFLATVLDDNDEIVGLGIAHPIMKGQHEDSLDQEGDTIFCDLGIALSYEAFQMLIFAMIERFGARKYIAWREAAHGFRHKVHSFPQFRRNVLRMKKHQLAEIMGGN